MTETLKDSPESRLPDTVSEDCAVAPEKRVSLALDYRRKGLSLKETGRLLGVSRQAVSKMLAKAGIDPGEVETYRETKNIVFHGKQKKLIDALNDKKIEKMSGAQLLVGVGILQDKVSALENPVSGILNSSVKWIDIVSAIHRPAEGNSWQQERRVLSDKGLDPDFEDKEYQARQRAQAVEAGPEVVAEYDGYMKDQSRRWKTKDITPKEDADDPGTVR